MSSLNVLGLVGVALIVMGVALGTVPPDGCDAAFVSDAYGCEEARQLLRPWAVAVLLGGLVLAGGAVVASLRAGDEKQRAANADGK